MLAGVPRSARAATQATPYAPPSDAMNLLPQDHPERFTLADEVHARPPEAIASPSRVSYLAIVVDADEREAERRHLATLCERFGAAPPRDGATHLSTTIGGLRLKWERHGEFSGYTFCMPGVSDIPFNDMPFKLLPPGWLSGLPGLTVVAAHVRLAPGAQTAPDPDELAACFDGNPTVGSEIGAGAGFAYTDFRIHDDGCSRFLVLDRGMTPRQAGRMLQRLLEIEVYRMMALLALPVARRLNPRIQSIEASLAKLTDDIAREDGGVDGGDEALLHELTRLAAEVESGLSATQFRFGACQAYHQLVLTRIAELREQRLPGTQTLEEFMARRLTPAMATCATVSKRLLSLSDRVAQASSLLSTRVDIARENQNQMLLASMNRRASLQLRLQQTVEGLSVAAIVYYVAGLVGYLAKGAKAAGAGLNADLAVAIAIPLIAVAAIWTIHRARRRIEKRDRAPT